MADQPTGGFRGFVQKPWGKVVLVLFGFAATAATFAYVTPLLAIPVLLVTGLALPIVGGIKRPRYLALTGLIVIVAVAPVANVVFSQMILTPVGAASSSDLAPFGSGGAVLNGAVITPFTGNSSTNFTWTVTFDPSHLDPSFNTTNWSHDSLQLFISSCPGAIDRNATYCNAGYTLLVINQSLTAPSGNRTFTFHHVIGSEGIWSWQIGLRIQNSTSGNFTEILLVGDPNYNGIQGPVIGGFWFVYDALLPDIYITAFVYLGLPFYFLLLLYMLLKSRERRRQDAVARAASRVSNNTGAVGPAEPASKSPTPLASSAATSSSAGHSDETAASAGASGEKSCASCGAVVYPSESKCWKCGAVLTSQ